METPPVPSVSTVSPGRRLFGPCISAFHTVTAAHGNVAASSNDRCGGRCNRPSAGNTACSASVPSSGKPKACGGRSEEHTSELQSRSDLVCRLLLEKKKKPYNSYNSVNKKKKNLKTL